MEVGDTVQFIGIPHEAQDGQELQTRALFEKCLGKCFALRAVEFFEGVPFPLARLDVGQVVGEKSYRHSIWVESEYLELQPNG